MKFILHFYKKLRESLDEFVSFIKDLIYIILWLKQIFIWLYHIFEFIKDLIS